jgi:ERCC4-type nuclease
MNVKFICDTREPWPHPWADHLPDECTIERGTMETGDWCVAGQEDGVVIERKTASDFLGTITTGRERFEKELRRARLDCRELIIMVEASLAVVLAKSGGMSEASLLGTVASFARRGVPVIFAGSVEHAAGIAFAAMLQPVKSLDKSLRSVVYQAKRKKAGAERFEAPAPADDDRAEGPGESRLIFGGLSPAQ